MNLFDLDFDAEPTVKRNGMGAHERQNEGESNVWLTPTWILEALGPFDLDPCAASECPDRVASRYFVELDDGLAQPWDGFVFCNPPYGPHVGAWLGRMAEHGNGIALVFARTDTSAMQAALAAASGALFVEGRLTFLHPTGAPGKWTGGAPSVLLAFGEEARRRLHRALSVPGVWFVPMSRPTEALTPLEPAPRAVDASDLGDVKAITITESGCTIACERGRVLLSVDQLNTLRHTLALKGTKA